MASTPQQPNDKIGRVLETLLAARKYRAVHQGLARTIAAAELAKGRSLKETVKATKNQLHQSAAVYFRQNLDYDEALRQLQAAIGSTTFERDAGAPGDDDSVRPILRCLMAAHASTYERLPLLDTFYRQLFQRLPPVNSVLDVACGLHPLARPWMPLPSALTLHRLRYIRRPNRLSQPLLRNDGLHRKSCAAQCAGGHERARG